VPPGNALPALDKPVHVAFRAVPAKAHADGRFDLILVVLLKEGFGLLEFYTEEMSRLEGVQSVETFVVYKSYNLKVPYIF